MEPGEGLGSHVLPADIHRPLSCLDFYSSLFPLYEDSILSGSRQNKITTSDHASDVSPRVMNHKPNVHLCITHSIMLDLLKLQAIR